jgi:hypothetical protein
MVQMRRKDYRNPATTRLLKAIEVGLRFRFLIFEGRSKFRPKAMGHPLVKYEELKADISELLVEMDLILREAVQANLRDPDFLIQIWEKDRQNYVKEMDDLWEVVLKKLYMASEEVLEAEEGEIFERKRVEFVNALTDLREKIEKMNREFTAHALSCLIKAVGLDLKDEPTLSAAGLDNGTTTAGRVSSPELSRPDLNEEAPQSVEPPRIE